jgi:hypothetical protein
MCHPRLYRQTNIAIAIKTTTLTTIPTIAPVCKPLRGERANDGVEEALAWSEVLVARDTDVVVEADMVLAGGEELVIPISKNETISKNDGKKVGLEGMPLVASQFPPPQLGQHCIFVTAP